MVDGPRPGRVASGRAPGGAPSDADRRRAVRDAVVAGGVAGLRDLDERLAAAGRPVAPDELRADLRALGVVRVSGPDGPVLAVPVGGGPGSRSGRPGPGGSAGPAASGPGPWPTITEDPDWTLQVVVVGVVLAFVLVGFLAWLLGG